MGALSILVVPECFCEIERSWRSDERCTAVLFGSLMVMSVCAPDPRKDLVECEKFTKEGTNILQEGRRAA